MEKSIKRKSIGFLALAIFLIACLLITICAPALSARATVNLPFTLVAPKNVTITKADGDSPTTMGFAFGITNEMNDFFVGYDNAIIAGTLSSYLSSKGVTYADEMWMLAQVDWALDDVEDAVSGWHYNEYWNDAPLGGLGQDSDGKYHCSTWDVVDMAVDASKTVTEAWLYRGFNEYDWLGNENLVGLKDQLRSSQYTFENYNVDGDVTISIDWTKHTIYSRARFVVVLRKDEQPDSFVFSDWSATVAYGKDAATAEPLEPGDVIAPTITGLRLTDEEFNDNPVVAFTLTVSDTLAAQKAQIAAANGTLRVEVEARVKGTTEWKDLHVAGEVTTGELTAALIYLAEPGQVIPAGTEIELRARYLVGQAGQEDFYSNYSKVIGFGSDDISIADQGTTTGTGDAATEDAESAKQKCKICHFCPQPLGLCIFIWIAIIVAVLVVGAIVALVLKKQKEKADKENR